MFDQESHPSHFQDEEVSKSVESLDLSFHQNLPSESIQKKRKVTAVDSDPRLIVVRALYEALDTNCDEELDTRSIREKMIL